MQTNLEKKAIEKRNIYDTLNDTSIFGGQGNEKHGNNPEDPYDINGGNSAKGGDESGSLSNHIYQNIDLTTGGDNEDIKSRERQLGYVVEGTDKYTFDKPYSSDLIDTNLNVGQVVIF